MPTSAASSPAIPTDQVVVSTAPLRVGFTLGTHQIAEQVLQQRERDHHDGGDSQQGAPVPPVELECRAADLANAHRAAQCYLARSSDRLGHAPALVLVLPERRVESVASPRLLGQGACRPKRRSTNGGS
jgi:hypothetical protein